MTYFLLVCFGILYTHAEKYLLLFFLGLLRNGFWIALSRATAAPIIIIIIIKCASSPFEGWNESANDSAEVPVFEDAPLFPRSNRLTSSSPAMIPTIVWMKCHRSRWQHLLGNKPSNTPLRWGQFSWKMSYVHTQKHYIHAMSYHSNTRAEKTWYITCLYI